MARNNGSSRQTWLQNESGRHGGVRGTAHVTCGGGPSIGGDKKPWVAVGTGRRNRDETVYCKVTHALYFCSHEIGKVRYDRRKQCGTNCDLMVAIVPTLARRGSSVTIVVAGGDSPLSPRPSPSPRVLPCAGLPRVIQRGEA